MTRSAFCVVFPTALILAIIASSAFSQITSFPYAERFDSVAVPGLPGGWTTTTNRLPGGDFATTTSGSRSAPNCVLSTNATISQILTSPTFDFTSRTPDKLQFYTSRSSTHTAGLLVEASTDNGSTFTIQLADTIKNPGTTGYFLTTIQLPGSLFNEPTVKFRWRLVGIPSGGTSGTFRLDDVNMSVFTTYDLGVSRISVSPSAPAATDPLVLTAIIKNFGTQLASGYAVRFFRDANQNQVADSSEEIGSVSGTPIFATDSASFSVVHPSIEGGQHRFIAIVSFTQDENLTNDTSSTVVLIGYTKGALVVNEIMYDPLTNQNEWIEVYHRG
ncbi:MAG: choice-of-anchor J domain-containing protein, partial [Ignavibacteriales bacterium]|nr:choice-of-anchor J domain-containing protein [Ignavibacteriales bacterium]